MDCYSELICSIYADGELDREETARLESHLAICASCRKLVNDLREESAALAQILHAPPQSACVVPRSPIFGFLSLMWILAAVAFASLGMHAFFAELSRLRLPAALAWLDPTSLWFHLSLIPSGLVYLLRGGNDMFLQNLSLASSVVFVVVCGCILRRRPAAALAAVVVMLALMLPSGASATEARFPRNENRTVIVAASETINDTLFIAGQTVVIDGIVNGDVIAAGESVRVTGSVGGSLVCVAKELELDGEVAGDVYSMNEFVNLQGAVQRNVHAIAKRVGLEPNGMIARDVIVFAEGAKFEGRVGGDARVSGRWAEVPGHVGRNLRFNGERLLVASTGYVGGNVTADVPDKKAVEIATGSETAERGVQGDVKIKETPRVTKSRFARPRFYVWQLVRLIAACITGLAFFWLAPGLFEPRRETGGSLLRSGGIGFIALVIVPIASVLAGITLVGLPLALLALAAWMGTMYLASVFVAVLVGRSLLRHDSANGRAFLLALLLGLLILRVAVNIPWVGGIIGFIVLIIGMGMAVSRAASLMRRVRAS